MFTQELIANHNEILSTKQVRTSPPYSGMRKYTLRLYAMTTQASAGIHSNFTSLLHL